MVDFTSGYSHENGICTTILLRKQTFRTQKIVTRETVHLPFIWTTVDWSRGTGHQYTGRISSLVVSQLRITWSVVDDHIENIKENK